MAVIKFHVHKLICSEKDGKNTVQSYEIFKWCSEKVTTLDKSKRRVGKKVAGWIKVLAPKTACLNSVSGFHMVGEKQLPQVVLDFYVYTHTYTHTYIVTKSKQRHEIKKWQGNGKGERPFKYILSRTSVMCRKHTQINFF